MKHKLACLLGATALTTMGAAGFSDGIDPTVLTEGQVVGQISQLATFSGTTGSSAYTFTPTWSQELGFAASGAVGYQASDNTALGLFITAGQRQREFLLNFGLAIDPDRQIVFSGGQLQDKLEFGTDGAQEWAKQAEYGVAYDASNYSLSLYHVNSESTDNFVGAKSTGAEIDGTAALSSLASLSYAAGYQSLDWDDGSEGDNGLTARLGLDYQATPDVMLNVFADHNVSENQFGLGAQWQVGAGTLNAQYTRIDGNVGSISDDNRVALTFAMPLGGSSRVASGMTRAATGANGGAVVAPSSSLLADVMRRPEYLPERVIVKASEDVGSSALQSCSLDVGAFRTVGSSWNGSSMDIVPNDTFTDVGYYVQIDVVIDPTIINDRFNQISSNNSVGAYTFDLEGVALDMIGNGFSDTTSLIFSWTGGPSGTLAPNTLTLKMTGPSSFESACTVQVDIVP